MLKSDRNLRRQISPDLPYYSPTTQKELLLEPENMEAAGLVLGVIPLAIKALGTYRDILSAMKNIKRDLEYMIRDLNTEQQILQNTCETLLKGIAPDSMLDDMIEDPFGPSWSQYNNEVRLRLWRSANVFQELVEEMKKAAIELREKLAIDQNGKVRPQVICVLSPPTHRISNDFNADAAC